MSASVLDATIKDKSLSGVELTFQKDGESLSKAFTDSKGSVNIPTPFGKDDSSVSMILKKRVMQVWQ